MKVIIHRGIDQIGGCITEIASAGGSRIIIDLGHNLPKGGIDEPDEFADGQVIKNLTDGVKGIFYTHNHGDHIELFSLVPDGIPQYSGALALKMMQAKCRHCSFVEEWKEECDAKLAKLDAFRTYRIAEPVIVGDISVTPYAVSHSAPDSYMLMVECDGKRVLHTGDFREHGYTGGKLFDFMRKYGIAGNIDMLITEGTNIGQNDKRMKPESEVREEMLSIMKKYRTVFVLASSSDADRLESVWAATRRVHRPFLCDRYQKEIMGLIAEDRAGKGRYYQFDRDRIYTDWSHGGKLQDWMKRDGFTMMVRPSEKFSNLTSELLSRCRPEETCVIYSMFEGYINPEHEAFNVKTKEFVDQFPNYAYCHTSGHASKETIERMCVTANPRSALIPIHRMAEADFSLLNIPEELKSKIVMTSAVKDDIEIEVR